MSEFVKKKKQNINLSIVLARGEFSKTIMDEISVNLSPEYYINPHRSVIGLGNYDVNVIMAALQSRGMNLVWYDKRKEISPESLEISKTFGYILNIPTSTYTLGFVTLPIKSRHWICIRRLKDDKFYNLDSKLDRPKCIGNNEDLVKYLQIEMKSNDKEIFLVFPQLDEEQSKG